MSFKAIEAMGVPKLAALRDRSKKTQLPSTHLGRAKIWYFDEKN
jgi:hypothetical protein